MNTCKAIGRVAKAGGVGAMILWAQVNAQNTIAAKMLLEAQYGRGNFAAGADIGLPKMLAPYPTFTPVPWPSAMWCRFRG